MKQTNRKAPPVTQTYTFTHDSAYGLLPAWVRRVTTPSPATFVLSDELAQRLPLIVTLPIDDGKPGATMNYPVRVGDSIERCLKKITYHRSSLEGIESLRDRREAAKEPESRITPLADRASDELWSVLRWFASINESGRTMMTMPEMNMLDIALRAVHVRVQDVATQIRRLESNGGASKIDLKQYGTIVLGRDVRGTLNETTR